MSFYHTVPILNLIELYQYTTLVLHTYFILSIQFTKHNLKCPEFNCILVKHFPNDCT